MRKKKKKFGEENGNGLAGVMGVFVLILEFFFVSWIGNDFYYLSWYSDLILWRIGETENVLPNVQSLQ